MIWVWHTTQTSATAEHIIHKLLQLLLQLLINIFIHMSVLMFCFFSSSSFSFSPADPLLAQRVWGRCRDAHKLHQPAATVVAASVWSPGTKYTHTHTDVRQLLFPLQSVNGPQTFRHRKIKQWWTCRRLVVCLCSWGAIGQSHRLWNPLTLNFRKWLLRPMTKLSISQTSGRKEVSLSFLDIL